MWALDLRSGYFQLAVNPGHIAITAFVTKHGTYAFRPMPFGLSGAAPNFQKAIDINLKPVIGKFVNIYMDDVIISSPSFIQHIALRDAGLTLNKDKCRKLNTPFQKLVMVSDGTEFAVGDIERLYDEARRNTKAKHEKWGKYYNRRRRDMQIKYGRKKGSGVKRELEGKEIRFKTDQGGRHTGKTDKRGPLIRSPPGSWSDPSRKIKMRRKENVRKKSRTEETVMPSTSGYNLRQRKGAKVESRPAIEMTTLQGGSVRARNNQEKHYSPYIEEQA
ncbi:retrovirus-related Pol polyprotein from transposon 17.6 [Trichonephila clavipes]|nr:retrovirus-related Pol polyprotein from transposon 17.6 [Trichonephila clavipes]